MRIAGMGKKPPRHDKKYATFNRRMMAATIDSLILMFTTPVFNILFPIRTDSLQKYTVDMADPAAGQRYLMQVLTDADFMISWMTNGFAQVIVFCILSGICWHYWSATPGKMLMRIKIVDADSEQRITTNQIVVRASAYILSGLAFFMGFFWIGINKRRQGWHDTVANTVVIVIPWRKPEIPENFGPK